MLIWSLMKRDQPGNNWISSKWSLFWSWNKQSWIEIDRIFSLDWELEVVMTKSHWNWSRQEEGTMERVDDREKILLPWSWVHVQKKRMRTELSLQFFVQNKDSSKQPADLSRTSMTSKCFRVRSRVWQEGKGRKLMVDKYQWIKNSIKRRKRSAARRVECEDRLTFCFDESAERIFFFYPPDLGRTTSAFYLWERFVPRWRWRQWINRSEFDWSIRAIKIGQCSLNLSYRSLEESETMRWKRRKSWSNVH